jgi:hypothetical protein
MYIGNIPADKYQTLEKQQFTVSATTTYTLNYTVNNPQDIRLVINNVPQNPNTSYTVNGTALTLSSPGTSLGDTMYCVFLGKAIGTIAPASSSVTNDMLSGSIATSKLADGSTFGQTNTPSFFANKSATQNISNNAYTKVAIDTEVFDTDSAYDNSSNYRFTVPSGKAGKYFLFAQVTLSHTNKWREGLVAFYKNGNQDNTTRSYKYFGSGNNQAEDFTVNISGAYDLSVGDYIEVYGYINGGASTQARFISNGTNFGGYKIIGA